MLGGEDSSKDLSEFVARSAKKDPVSLLTSLDGSRSLLTVKDLFSSDLPSIDETVRVNIASMLSRPAPDEARTKDMIFKQSVGTDVRVKL
jgi:hypothetical protein